MLVRFEDTRGKVIWINPVHVRLIRAKKANITEIQTPGSNIFTKVRLPIDEVADMLNAAMPDISYVPGLESATQQAGVAAGARMLDDLNDMMDGTHRYA